MTRQELLNIAGVGSIQTLINAELNRDVNFYSIEVDGMFGPKTLKGLNDLLALRLGWTKFQTTAEELRLPPLPESGYWENGVDVFQQWYGAVYYKFKERSGTVHFRKPQKDGKWGVNTYRCFLSLIVDFNKPLSL